MSAVAIVGIVVVILAALFFRWLAKRNQPPPCGRGKMEIADEKLVEIVWEISDSVRKHRIGVGTEPRLFCNRNTLSRLRLLQDDSGQFLWQANYTTSDEPSTFCECKIVNDPDMADGDLLLVGFFKSIMWSGL